MNKTALIEAIAARSGLSKTMTSEALEATLGVLQDTLARGEPVQLTGFGSFEVSERAAREGRNPATGAALTIAAKKVVRFKVGKPLAEAAAAGTARDG